MKAVKESTARAINLSPNSTFDIRELLLHALSEKKRIWDEAQNLFGSAGSGHFEISVVQDSAQDTLGETNSFNFGQHDVERTSSNESCLTKHPLRRYTEF
jgi:hypothetical protein